MGKLIRLTENDLHRIVRDTLNEIGYSRLRNAAETKLDMSDITNAINVIKDGLQYYMGKMNDSGVLNNKQFNAACNGIKVIENFFSRKSGQQERFGEKLYDVEKSYFEEFNAKAKELYPSLRNVDIDKMGDEEYNNIVSKLSPEAREYFEKYY